MFKYTFVLILFLFSFLFMRLNCQLCTKKVIVTRWQQESYRHTYKETYRGHCWYRCVKSRISVLVDHRLVPKRMVEVRHICCSGYMDASNNSESINCKPICMPACKNGYCSSPGICVCDIGYAFDTASNHSCKPVCSNFCPYGNCVSPNTCECDFGYEKVEDECRPICTEPCRNGICVAPDICQCLPGYRSTEYDTCEPYCFSGCPNGHCIRPDTCSCNSGWLKNEENNTCVPDCSRPCGNGTCVAPDTCECFTGYEVDASQNRTSNATNCVPSCGNCINGSCTAPNECTCEHPLIPKLLSKNDGDCDCTKECSNSQIECEKTICLPEEFITTTYPTSVIPKLSSESYEPSTNSESTTELAIGTFSINNIDLTTKKIYISTNTYKSNTEESFEPVTYLNELGTKTYKRNTEESFEPVTYLNELGTNYDETKNETDSNESNLSLNVKKDDRTRLWVYATITSLILITLLLIIILTKRKSISRCLKGGHYVVQDDGGLTEISPPAQAVDVSYQSIMEKKNNENLSPKHS